MQNLLGYFTTHHLLLTIYRQTSQ